MKTIRFVAAYARNYIKPLAIAILAMIGLVGVQLLAPGIVRNLVSLVQQLDWSNPAARGAVSRLALLLLGIYLARIGFRFLANYMSHTAGWGVVADARRDIYQHLQRLSLSFYEEQQTGQLMSRMINDSEMFERLISHAIPDTLVSVLTLLGVTVVLLRMNPTLMLLTLIPVPLILVAMQAFNRYVRPAFRERQQELAELNATVNDNLSGIREIKAFTREEIEAVRVGRRIDRYRESMLKVLRYLAVFGPSVEFASSLGTVIVIYFGGRLAFQRILPLADLVAFLLYLEIFYQPVRTLAGVWEQVQEAMAGAERVSELLERDPDVADRPDAVPLPAPARGEVELVHVSFAYQRGGTVLKDISLNIPANSVLALVGPTGVGKTTLAGLIPRFYDVTEGAVLVDGHDVRSLTSHSLRENIAIVLQDVFLFHGTVRDNILFGNPGATEAEVIDAARVANAH
ncbi:MAG: ABC transporter ATP-binding protein, partial [Chloroflexi bacterium]|nr:ABC transporter ATP-binding protein [Chloroflexota bacterium]